VQRQKSPELNLKLKIFVLNGRFDVLLATSYFFVCHTPFPLQKYVSKLEAGMLAPGLFGVELK
jgi:hypothetical protein